ncbi:hypothetical protein [Elizabethkingia anophelis]|uniref:hypothetical protein n=1 Tax=Elizabethkingia anophelis TaxID=1117645 RepID=UPI0008402FE8|nr:hypothetical protein [Elizabethkingia anophelis]MCT3803337.1 hypothetical protein [Elizabethkingia anophelis]MCT3982163.1 hypothetical protein [Elizabethkingia anophelis]MCT4060168.1 hypothetical protein [Elizabethkingia anophelis]MCT4070859.1 hypothetical protein [Elizabethkingia anophelis]MCT4120812.1 hypothetical protein [Elizabethkingia anophelis]
MKKEAISDFEIKLEFNKDTENPSRLFRSFANIIEDIQKLDITLARCINTSISSKIYLNDIEKGSLIGRLWNELVINEEGKLDDLEDSKKITNFIDKSRNKALEFIQDRKHSVAELEELSKNIENFAKEEDLDKTFNYADPDILELANSINNITDTTEKLSDNEALIFSNHLNSSRKLTNKIEKIDIEDVEKALTTEEINNETTVFYKIKKPDFLGDSQWEFKHGNKSIKIKILDEDWLERFKNGKEIVIPGDSLKVQIKQCFRYNRNGYLISEKTEITRVLSIIKN